MNLLSLIFIAIYTLIVFRYLAEKKINYIKKYLSVSVLHFLATIAIIFGFYKTLFNYFITLNWALTIFFVLIILFIVVIYYIFRKYINNDIVIKDQKSGTYATSLNPYYAVSKSFNVLFQQTLVLTTVLILKNMGLEPFMIVVIFAIAFGVAHIILVDRHKPYTPLVIMASFPGGAVFPILLLYSHYGFIYSYLLHWSFLIVIGILPHLISKKNYEDRHKSYLPLITIGILFLLIYLVGNKIPEVTIKEAIKTVGPLGPLVLILLIWLTNIIAPLSATPFFFVGFYLFGSIVVFYSFIAAFFASITNFWIARIWGRTLVIKLAGEDNLRKIDRLTENYGLQTLFVIRVFLSQFYDVISYIFGLTQVKFTPYLVVSTLGTIPGTIIWYFLSSKINNPLAFTLLTLGIAYVSLTIYILWMKIAKKENKFSKKNINNL